MTSEAALESKLTVAAVAHRLTSEMELLGFAPIKAKSLKLVKMINDDTGVFLHPGVMRTGADVRVDPVIGIDNVTLRERLLALDRQRWRGSASVCHAYLGILASWSRFYLRTGDQLDYAAAQIVKSVIDIGLPIMSEFDSLDKVRQLFHDELTGTKRAKVVVLFAKEKLSYCSQKRSSRRSKDTEEEKALGNVTTATTPSTRPSPTTRSTG
jgi:hypothetical protein